VKCRVLGCTGSHHVDQVCCRPHWFALPQAVRSEIWTLFREEDGSDAHRTAVLKALEWLDDRAAAKAARS
jgi:hypothetical protein